MTVRVNDQQRYMRATTCVICMEEVALIEVTPVPDGRSVEMAAAKDAMRSHLQARHKNELLEFAADSAAEHRTYRLVEESATVTPR